MFKTIYDSSRRTSRPNRRRGRRALAVIAAGAAAVLALSSCSSSKSTATNTASGSPLATTGAPPAANLLVWTDAARQPGFETYQKANAATGTNLNIATLPDQFPQKILLDTKAGKGWPDVLFDGGLNNVSLFSQRPYDYAADLTSLIPPDVVKQFYPGSIAPCEVDGKLYCLRNDYAPNLLWYNTKLMRQFGYTVPTTYEEYEALGTKLASEHPGYQVGAIGGDQGTFFLAGSGCNFGQVDGQKFSVDLKSDKCTRAISLLDNLSSAGVMSPYGEFSPEYTKATGSTDKTLMMVGPVWYGEYLFKETYKVPAGEMSIAAPLKWAGDSSTDNGTYGGGVYYVSKHAKDPRAAAALALWMATSQEFQSNGPTFPAYQPVARQWLTKQQSAGVINTPDLGTIIDAAAKAVDPKQQAELNIPSTIDRGWASQVVPAITAKKPISSVVDSWQKFMQNSAQAAGFQVD